MKTIQSIILTIILIIGSFWFTQTSADSQSELDSFTQELLIIKNGNAYKLVIDRFIENNKENTVKLEWILSKLALIHTKLENKNDKNSIILKTIFNYLDINIFIILNSIVVDDLIDEINIQVVIDDEYNNSKKITYPGFTEDYIEDNKTILAWEEAFIYKQSYSSLYEASEVWKAIFYISWPDVGDLKNTIESASLYLEWSMIDTVWSSKIDIMSSSLAKITFNNLNDFIITENVREARLKIKTSNIWFQKIGKTIWNLYVSKVWFDDIRGLSSSKTLDSYSVTKVWELFSIVTGVLDISVKKNLSSNIPEINLKWLFWNNSIDSSNGSPVIELDNIRFSTLWSTWNADVIYSIYNSDRSGDKVLGTVYWDTVEFDMSWMLYTNKTITNSSKWEDYKIVLEWTNSNTVIVLSLIKDWIDYHILWTSNSNNIKINLKKELNLWTKNY